MLLWGHPALHHQQASPIGLLLLEMTQCELPAVQRNRPIQRQATVTVELPAASLSDSHTTLLATLVAEVPDDRLESAPIWIIQVGHLTYEPSEGSSSTQRTIEDFGEGLLEFLDEISRREGASAVIEYLKSSSSGRLKPSNRVHIASIS